MVRILKGEKINGSRHSKPMLNLDLTLKTVSDQSHAEVECFWWAYLFGILLAYWLDQERI